MRTLWAIILHTSRVVIFGRTGRVFVMIEPCISSGTTIFRTDRNSVSDATLHCTIKSSRHTLAATDTTIQTENTHCTIVLINWSKTSLLPRARKQMKIEVLLVCWLTCLLHMMTNEFKVLVECWIEAEMNLKKHVPKATWYQRPMWWAGTTAMAQLFWPTV